MSFKIHTYHCICSSLLLVSTHSLNSLPRRSLDSGSADSALILPVTDTPPVIEELGQTLPTTGYSTFFGIEMDSKIKVIRKGNGFERRLLHRCSRCKIVVGYEILGQREDIDMEDKETAPSAKTLVSGGFNVVYLLPGGMMSTNAIAGKRLPIKDDIQVGEGIKGVFE